MQAAEPQVAGGGVDEASPAALCPGCGVRTFRQLCHFCRKTVELIKAERCVACTAPILAVDYQKAQGKCGECLSANHRLSFATRRLLHQAANARYYARAAA